MPHTVNALRDGSMNKGMWSLTKTEVPRIHPEVRSVARRVPGLRNVKATVTPIPRGDVLVAVVLHFG